MSRHSIAALAAACLAFGSWASAESKPLQVAGKWNLTAVTPRGERTSEISIAQDGEKLTVTSTSRQGEKVESPGTLKGDAITWTVRRQTPRGEMVITYTGKVEGEKMSGQVQFGEERSGEWKATKITG